MTTRAWYGATAGAAAALILVAGPALAGGGGKQSGYQGSQPAASPKTEASADFMGRHTMEGEVTRIDQDQGTLSLKTAEGTMDLHFPPSALANVKEGDRIAVELALQPDAGGSASPATEPKPKQ